MNEGEIDESLKMLREKYGIEGFSLDAAQNNYSKFKVEEITLDFFKNAN